MAEDKSKKQENRIVGPVISTEEIHQPRQPQNLQDLLRYAVQAGSISNTNFQPLDEERRKFLEEALSSMTLDIIKELSEAMLTLSDLTNPSVGKKFDDVPAYQAALDTISGLVDNIDVANDFQKIGGLKLLNDCLSSNFGSIRWRAAEIIAQCTQNNSFCQMEALNQNLLSTLMQMTEKDQDEKCKIKAFYAVSCIVRDSQEGLNSFVQQDGFSFALRTLKSSNETLRTKSSFLISSLISLHPEFKESLTLKGYVEELITLIRTEHSRTHEHVICALLTLVSGNELAKAKCRDPELQLQHYLLSLRERLGNDEAYLEEIQYIKELLQLIFSCDTDESR